MAARKKRPIQAKSARKPTEKLDAGWASFIGTALKKRPQTLWPDPQLPRTSKKRKAAKKSTKK
jgi:hypothetical protein